MSRITLGLTGTTAELAKEEKDERPSGNDFQSATPAKVRKLSPRPADYVDLIYRHKWLLLLLVSSAVLATYILCGWRPRYYQAAITLDLDHHQIAAGPRSGSTDEYVNTQTQLLQSDAVLRPVAKKFGLPPAEAAKDRPASLVENLDIVRTPNTSLVQIRYRNEDPSRASEVANAVVASYIEMLGRNRDKSWRGSAALTESQIAGLRARMEESEDALRKAEKRLGIEGDKLEVSSAGAPVELREEYARAVADRATKEAAYEAVKTGDLGALLASKEGDALKKLVDRRNEAQRKFTELKQLFGENHPDYQRAQAEIKELTDQLNTAGAIVVQRAFAELRAAWTRETALRREVDKASGQGRSQNPGMAEYQALKQKADEDRGLYEAVVRRVSEVEAEARLQAPSARIIDAPQITPVRHHPVRNCLIALAGSAVPLIALLLVFGKPEVKLRAVNDVRTSTSHTVLGVFPCVRAWRSGLLNGSPAPHLLYTARASAASEMAYGEAMWKLRIVLLAGLNASGTRSLLVASPLPREGRSTIAANLAAAVADSGKRVLLIDADLRRPALNQLFPPSSMNGLSSVCRGEVGWREAVSVQAIRPLLHFIPAGPALECGEEARRAAIADMLAEASAEYDLILFDSPPFLHHPEAVDLVQAADQVLVAVRLGQTGQSALISLQGYLQRLGARVMGVVASEA